MIHGRIYTLRLQNVYKNNQYIEYSTCRFASCVDKLKWVELKWVELKWVELKWVEWQSGQMTGLLGRQTSRRT
jgi:hypothetical protein